MRSYSDRTLKLLWGRSAGRCAISSCRTDVLVEATQHDPIVVIGDIAHIEASSDRGPRANPKKKQKNRDEYDNLILLCKNCHATLDGQKRSNTVSFIKRVRTQHESWVRANLPARGKTRIGWRALLLQGAHPINRSSALAALSPDHHKSTQLIVGDRQKSEEWTGVFDRLKSNIGTIFRKNESPDTRFAVFPLAPVSSCIALGYLMTNRPTVRLFQYHRDDHNWRWKPDVTGEERITVKGLPKSVNSRAGDVAICISISANVLDSYLTGLGPNFIGKIEISVSDPSTAWLQRERQLIQLARVAREVYESASFLFPKSKKWHFFCAVPAPAAVIVGQQLNPTMCPPVQLYEFNRKLKPNYQPSMLLHQ